MSVQTREERKKERKKRNERKIIAEQLQLL
jgi:hypothetical protein